MTTATHTKLNSGDWGIRVQGDVTTGQTVTVTKRDGSTKVETVKAAVWSGNGVSICAIGGSEARRYTATKPAARCTCDSDPQGWCPKCDGSRRRRLVHK